MKKLKSLIYKLYKYSDKIIYKFKPAIHIKSAKELHFTILITAYNNKKYAKNCLESVFSQKYQNFDIYYVDDASSDGSAQIAEKVLRNRKNGRFQGNSIRVGKLENLYNAIQSLENTIIIELDGDDYLIDDQVLYRFNECYSKDALAVHSSYQNNPTELARKLNLGHFSQRTPNFVIKTKSYREFPWIYSGLISYKPELFKKIKKYDLMAKFNSHKNKFLPAFHDAAVFYPILEMAGSRIDYIAEPQILRNIDSEINDFKTKDQETIRLAKRQVVDTKPY